MTPTKNTRCGAIRILSIGASNDEIARSLASLGAITHALGLPRDGVAYKLAHRTFWSVTTDGLRTREIYAEAEARLQCGDFPP